VDAQRRRRITATIAGLSKDKCKLVFGCGWYLSVMMNVTSIEGTSPPHLVVNSAEECVVSVTRKPLDDDSASQTRVKTLLIGIDKFIPHYCSYFKQMSNAQGRPV